ncbi:MAG: hypothetical protein Rsou_1480 [Candidatus Ruthia sp. Asou_11_S2]|nr:hypothetical protein [Candidatus Ruthia sp. Asou_11_S2]
MLVEFLMGQAFACLKTFAKHWQGTAAVVFYLECKTLKDL